MWKEEKEIEKMQHTCFKYSEIPEKQHIDTFTSVWNAIRFLLFATL